MSDIAELKKLVKDLQSASSNQVCPRFSPRSTLFVSFALTSASARPPSYYLQERVSILQILKKNFQVNEAVLRESKAGLAVGKLRTHDAKEVSDLAKEIVKKWKTEVERAKGGAGSKTPSNGKPLATRKPSSVPTPVTGVAAPAANGKSEVRSAKNDGVKISVTGDATRDKCIELIYDGLACDSGARLNRLAATDLIVSRAKGVEQAVYVQFGSTSPEYRGKIRSLFVNLKDKGNPSLRESIVSGELSPEKFSKMTSEEMMSEERRAADQKIKEENFFKSLGAGEQEAETEGFQCGRCKQRKCRYRQAQTRSADEPMTEHPLWLNASLSFTDASIVATDGSSLRITQTDPVFCAGVFPLSYSFPFVNS
ncbi:hypothetical protein ID866_7720, partial [Astraeus odoratus]